MVFAPSSVRVERSKVINADKQLIFDQVNNLMNWNAWMPWNKIDPKMKRKYFGATEGEGAGYSWESDDDRVGNGKITIIGSYGNDSIFTELDFLENGKGIGSYYFNDSPSGVDVKWAMESELSFFTRWVAWFMDGWVGPDFEKGLNSLDSLVQSLKPVTVNIPEGVQGVVDFPPMTLLAVKDSANPKDISFKIGKNFGIIQENMKKGGLNFAGSPLCIYYTNEPDNFVFHAAIPVDKAPKAVDAGVEVITWSQTRCLKYNYFGSYDKMFPAYEKIKEHMKANNLTQAGAAREVYVTDPVTVSDPSQILTEIYIPLK